MSLSITPTLPSLAELPSTYLVHLDNYQAISLIGEENRKYLQGQVTCDVNSLKAHDLLHGAHCDSKGKVLAVFRLIERLSALLLIQPTASLETSLPELKKFGVFAKVDIKTAQELSLYALVGENASQILQQSYQQVPDSLRPVIQVNSTTLVYIAGQKNRYIIIDQQEQLKNIIGDWSLPLYGQAVWELTEINEGFPTLTTNSLQQYVPQMLNLQAINGISFTKGCYIGQETVARMQYLGKNKRALYQLVKNLALTEKITMTADDVIEKQLGDNWRKAGDIISYYQADNTQLYIQAILTNDVDENTVLRLKQHPDVTLSLADLPYTITEKT